ncbi:MAG: hypothetical protein M3179_05085, partial [Actinomycetota bacterium]|nr:hypothetical protein [Actinomycetota bacterium]
MPPRPTAGSWAGSPTQTSRQRWRWTRATRASRSSVEAIDASSRTTVESADRRHAAPGPPGRACSCSSLANVVAGQPVSAASTSAAFPDGARPRTGRPWPPSSRAARP